MLGSTFGVRGIPALIVINASDGSIISREGRQDVMTRGAAAFTLWESMGVSAQPEDVSVVQMLRENDPEVMKEAAEILLKLLGNVQRNPDNIKYRSVKLSNPKIESKLLVANGAFEILFSAGFEEVIKTLFCFNDQLIAHFHCKFCSQMIL